MATNKINSLQMPESEDWHIVGTEGEPAFQNGWVQYSWDHPQISFYKDNYGIVHLKGLTKSGTANTIIYTLPVGYRPKENMHLIIQGNQTDPVCTAHVYANGDVKERTGDNVWMTLDGISFKADN